MVRNVVGREWRTSTAPENETARTSIVSSVLLESHQEFILTTQIRYLHACYVRHASAVAAKEPVVIHTRKHDIHTRDHTKDATP